MNRGARVIEAISDRTNPVVVKELRQAVQSRLVIAILLLFLLVNVVIVCGYLLVSTDAGLNERAGQNLFGTLFGVLVATCTIFVPLYAATRLTMERNDSNIDLLFITTIAPAAIIRGKFWAALALTALIYSAAMPFLTFTYLLRGIDLPSIFFALGIAFLLNAAGIMFAIFVGSVAGGLLLRFVMAGLLLIAVYFVLFSAIGLGFRIVEMGLSSMFRSNESWAEFGFSTLLGLSVSGLLYLLAVASVSARSSNRMFPVRVFVTLFWLISGAVLGIWGWIDSTIEPVMVWCYVSLAALSVILCFTLGERENWSPRVRRHIPRALPLRFLAWPFFTGSAGGMIWCCALSAVTLLVGYSIVDDPTHIGRMRDAAATLRTMLGVLLFAWCYSMSGLFVRRIVAPKSPPLVGTAIGMGLLGVVGALSMIVVVLIHGLDWQFESLPIGYWIANPFVLGRTASDLVYVFYFLAMWASLALLVNISWFLQQWQAFRRHVPRPVPLPASPAEEPPVVHA